jgi:hypothetical protein
MHATRSAVVAAKPPTPIGGEASLRRIAVTHGAGRNGQRPLDCVGNGVQDRSDVPDQAGVVTVDRQVCPPKYA